MLLFLLIGIVCYLAGVGTMMLVQAQVEKKSIQAVTTEDVSQVRSDVQLAVASVKADVAAVTAKVDAVFHMVNTANTVPASATPAATPVAKA